MSIKPKLSSISHKMEERLKLFNIDEEHLSTEMQDRVSRMLSPFLGKQRSSSPVGV